MNILYFFQELDTPMFQWQRTHLIDELMRHGCNVEVINPLLYDSALIANEKLQERINHGNIDLFFTNICYHKMLFVETVEFIRSKGIPTLSLRCDNLIIPYNDQVLAPHFDLVWLTSKETRHLYDGWGCRSFFAPYAANPYTFRYSPSTLIPKVVFIGTPYGSRAKMINALTIGGVGVDAFFGKNPSQQEQVATFEPRYDIIQLNRYSTLFNQLRFREGRTLIKGRIANLFMGHNKIEENQFLTRCYAISPSEISSYYSQYALSLASTSTNHTDVLKFPLKIINLRNFEIPMSGGIEICKYNEELSEYFEENKEILFYRTDDELIDKAKYYTQKASHIEIRRVKEAARLRAENEHTWWKRFCIAFEILGIRY